MTRDICVVGLGYVGLPLAVEFGKKQQVTGFDINQTKIDELVAGHDSMDEVTDEDLRLADVRYTSDAGQIENSDFVIVAVPTPVDDHNKPDLTPVIRASETVGRHIKPGSIVVYESTVYPGVTEDVCAPILEKESGMRCGLDFKIGYSPERVNPGDKEHTIPKIVKVVSGMDQESLETIAETYSNIISAGVHRAPSIKVAEAAKVIENAQRDINIAFVNELSMVFGPMGISTSDVIEAAATKWNFIKFTPGLVGGHCIGVDPYYLVHAAEKLGIHTKMITAGRSINDDMHKYVADMILKDMINTGNPVKGAPVTVLGLTFKENVTDMRNSRVKHLIGELQGYGLNVCAHDPMLPKEGIEEEFGVKNSDLSDLVASPVVVIGSPHRQFFTGPYTDYLRSCASEGANLIDIKGSFKGRELPEGMTYRSL